jgi:hypothetical protein
MHKTSIHVFLKEIRGETHLNPRNHTKNKGTKNKHEKDHEIHNAKSSIQTRKDSQGLAFTSTPCHFRPEQLQLSFTPLLSPFGSKLVRFVEGVKRI